MTVIACECTGTNALEPMYGNQCMGTNVWEPMYGTNAWEPMYGNQCTGTNAWEPGLLSITSYCNDYIFGVNVNQAITLQLITRNTIL